MQNKGDFTKLNNNENVLLFKHRKWKIIVDCLPITLYFYYLFIVWHQMVISPFTLDGPYKKVRQTHSNQWCFIYILNVFSPNQWLTLKCAHKTFNITTVGKAFTVGPGLACAMWGWADTSRFQKFSEANSMYQRNVV